LRRNGGGLLRRHIITTYGGVCVLHQWLFDCAYALGRVYRGECDEDRIFYEVRGARCSWIGYIKEVEGSVPPVDSPIGKARTALCASLDSAFVYVCRAHETGKKLDKEKVKVAVSCALAGIFQYMAALVGVDMG